MGQKIVITTPMFYKDNDFCFNSFENLQSVFVPLDPLTLSRLQTIEAFVQASVQSDIYKALKLGTGIYCNISKWCKFLKYTSDGVMKTMEDESSLGKGTYSFDLQVSHVYVGPHRGGETFSITLHVVSIIHTEIHDVSEEQSKQTSQTPPPPSDAAKVKAESGDERCRQSEEKDGHKRSRVGRFLRSISRWRTRRWRPRFHELDYSVNLVCSECHLSLLRYVRINKCRHVTCIICVDKHVKARPYV